MTKSLNILIFTLLKESQVSIRLLYCVTMNEFRQMKMGSGHQCKVPWVKVKIIMLHTYLCWSQISIRWAACKEKFTVFFGLAGK